MLQEKEMHKTHIIHSVKGGRSYEPKVFIYIQGNLFYHTIDYRNLHTGNGRGKYC